MGKEAGVGISGSEEREFLPRCCHWATAVLLVGDRYEELGLLIYCCLPRGLKGVIYFATLVTMKSFLKLGSALALSWFAVEGAARVVGYSPQEWIVPYKREALQNIVSEEAGWIQGNADEMIGYVG
jgi:hypothetical protein